jgi:uncharacterized protein DUF3311
MAMDRETHKNGEWRNKGLLWLLLIPNLIVWVPFYNRIEPQLFGFPFFYWFQLVWIFVSMIITAFVYYATEVRAADDGR